MGARPYMWLRAWVSVLLQGQKELKKKNPTKLFERFSMLLILNKPFPDYQIKAAFPWQTWALCKLSQDCSIWLNPAQIKAKLSLHKLSLKGAGCSWCREKDRAGNCRQRIKNARGSSRIQRRGGEEERRQGPVLYEGLVTSLQREFENQSHSSLRLRQLPDGNPPEHSLNTPVHSSATAFTKRLFACRGFSQSHCFNTLLKIFISECLWLGEG